MIWTDEFLSRIVADGEVDLCNDIQCLFKRYQLRCQANVGVYLLPIDVSEIIRVTWKGYDLEPLTQQELIKTSAIYRTQRSRPYWYSLSNDGYANIRLYPAPNEDLMGLKGCFAPQAFNWDAFLVWYPLNLYSDEVKNACVITAYQVPDITTEFFQIPNWLARNIIKYYALWRCYSIEGPGQRLDLSDFYKKMYEQYKEVFRSINEYKDLPVIRGLEAGAGPIQKKPARPVLPASFREL